MIFQTRQRISRAWFVPQGPRRPDKPEGRRRSWLAWTALALLAGCLLFCHGCHGDEDNELFVGRRPPVTMALMEAGRALLPGAPR